MFCLCFPHPASEFTHPWIHLFKWAAIVHFYLTEASFHINPDAELKVLLIDLWAAFALLCNDLALRKESLWHTHRRSGRPLLIKHLKCPFINTDELIFSAKRHTSPDEVLRKKEALHINECGSVHCTGTMGYNWVSAKIPVNCWRNRAEIKRSSRDREATTVQEGWIKLHGSCRRAEWLGNDRMSNVWKGMKALTTKWRHFYYWKLLSTIPEL